MWYIYSCVLFKNKNLNFVFQIVHIYFLFQSSSSGSGKSKKKPPTITSSNSSDFNEEGVGSNIRSIVTISMLLVLMMFVVHCTWVTSNAYSSPSIVLASFSSDGYDLFV